MAAVCTAAIGFYIINSTIGLEANCTAVCPNVSCAVELAIFAVGDFHEDLARAEIEKILRQTEGCSIEIVMKDISTVDYKPWKLQKWAQICKETIDAWYN